MRRALFGTEREMLRLDDAAAKAADRIRSKAGKGVCTAIILGSGLARIAKMVEKRTAIEYRSIPGFALPSAPGHAGTFVCGEISGERVAVMSGRPHLYDGYDRTVVTFPIRVVRELGATTLIVTNAAGAVNPRFAAGDLMLITDHIDLTFTTVPTAGHPDVPFAKRHFRYDAELRNVATREAGRLGEKLWAGTYVALSGPNYETQAEMQMLERIGADAVGMSTVAETIEAFRLGMRTLGISCIANPRRRPVQLTHVDVERAAQPVAPALGRLIAAIVSSTREMPLPPRS